MSANPPPLPPIQPATVGPSPARVWFMVAIWVTWLGVMGIADFMGILMFAFADSPGAGNAAKMMIVPAFAWFGITFIAGAVLLILGRTWQIVVAFVLAISPPFLIFAGYNVLGGASAGGSGARSTWSVPTTSPATSAPVMNMPPGGFAPKFTPPTQPDFRKYFPTTATTRPATTRPERRVGAR